MSSGASGASVVVLGICRQNGPAAAASGLEQFRDTANATATRSVRTRGGQVQAQEASVAGKGETQRNNARAIKKQPHVHRRSVSGALGAKCAADPGYLLLS